MNNENFVKVKVKDFLPKHIFECGQAFRWIPDDVSGEFSDGVSDKSFDGTFEKYFGGKYTGVAGGHAATIYMENPETLIIENCTQKDFDDFWYDYFDLGRDYSVIKAAVSKDSVMEAAVEFGKGIRILKQDFNEMLFSFIISANNRIPRIMKSVETLSRLYGNKIEYFSEKNCKYYTFPAIETLAGLTVEEINLCKAGFRCKYISSSAKKLTMEPVPFIRNEINEAGSIVTFKKELLSLPGVGPKVADCIMLFSGLDYSAFPTDVWVKRVMEELYFKREASLKEITEFAKEYWGEYAGFAQQYLFYYARENGIGKN